VGGGAPVALLATASLCSEHSSRAYTAFETSPLPAARTAPCNLLRAPVRFESVQHLLIGPGPAPLADRSPQNPPHEMTFKSAE